MGHVDHRAIRSPNEVPCALEERSNFRAGGSEYFDGLRWCGLFLGLLAVVDAGGQGDRRGEPDRDGRATQMRRGLPTLPMDHHSAGRRATLARTAARSSARIAQREARCRSEAARGWPRTFIAAGTWGLSSVTSVVTATRTAIDGLAHGLSSRSRARCHTDVAAQEFIEVSFARARNSCPSAHSIEGPRHGRNARVAVARPLLSLHSTGAHALHMRASVAARTSCVSPS
jgi:hypothetical protein